MAVLTESLAMKCLEATGTGSPWSGPIFRGRGAEQGRLNKEGIWNFSQLNEQFTSAACMHGGLCPMISGNDASVVSGDGRVPTWHMFGRGNVPWSANRTALLCYQQLSLAATASLQPYLLVYARVGGHHSTSNTKPCKAMAMGECFICSHHVLTVA
jgi:hypothetical protein